MTSGLVGSLLLHAAALLLALFVLPWLLQMPAPTEAMMTVDLVQLGETMAAPASSDIAPVPQEKAAENALQETTDVVPPSQTVPAPPERRAMTDGAAASEPGRGAERTEPSKAPVPQKRPIAKAVQQPPDDLGTRLRLLAQQRRPAPAIARQPAVGSSNATTNSPAANLARDATYRVRDFIRAQVERHWHLDRSAAEGGNWVVAVHISLAPDGSVRGADIVDDPRYRSSPAYLAVAQSARNAVLLASPLTIPAGDYEIAKELVIDFDPKQALR